MKQQLKKFGKILVPAIWNKNQVDEIKEVNLKDAEETLRLLALQEGIFVGPSSGAIFHITLKKQNN